ncbi:MAG: hypothetical protein VZR24_16945, partial [Butyrivibrio hungatei]|nr:hypothetical protein [Butyrivibrio hungatei]
LGKLYLKTRFIIIIHYMRGYIQWSLAFFATNLGYFPIWWEDNLTPSRLSWEDNLTRMAL